MPLVWIFITVHWEVLNGYCSANCCIIVDSAFQCMQLSGLLYCYWTKIIKYYSSLSFTVVGRCSFSGFVWCCLELSHFGEFVGYFGFFLSVQSRQPLATCLKWTALLWNLLANFLEHLSCNSKLKLLLGNFVWFIIFYSFIY